jgi:hypothetical protein
MRPSLKQFGPEILRLVQNRADENVIGFDRVESVVRLVGVAAIAGHDLVCGTPDTGKAGDKIESAFESSNVSLGVDYAEPTSCKVSDVE